MIQAATWSHPPTARKNPGDVASLPASRNFHQSHGPRLPNNVQNIQIWLLRFLGPSLRGLFSDHEAIPSPLFPWFL